MSHPFRLCMIAALAFAACTDKTDDTDMDTDTFDPGTDVDTDADTDMDTDMDTDVDTDVDTEAPTNLLTNPGFEATPGFQDWFIFPGELTNREITTTARTGACLLYTSDAADE